MGQRTVVGPYDHALGPGGRRRVAALEGAVVWVAARDGDAGWGRGGGAGISGARGAGDHSAGRCFATGHDGDGHQGDDGHDAEGYQAPPGPASLADLAGGSGQHVVEVGRGGEALGLSVQCLVQVDHGSRSSRSLASARCRVDFTVPTRTPMTRAISASGRSS